MKCVESLESVKVVLQYLAAKRKITRKPSFLMLPNSETFKKRVTVKIYKKHEICSMPLGSETQ